MAKRNSAKNIVERILKDAAVRTGITTRSLLWFVRIYLSEYVRYKTAPFQHQIIRMAEQEKQEMVVISAFRGSSKSTLVTTAYVLWAILGKQQRKFAVILSQTEDKARMHLNNIKRELEDNELLRRDLGPFEEEHGPWGSHTLFIPKFNAKITIGSVEKSIRGYRHNSRRPDLLVIDDAESLESIKTREGREKVWNWLVGEVLPVRDHGTRVFVVGNLIAEDSLTDRLRKQIRSGERDGVYLEFPIADDEGNPLWPGKFPTAADVENERRKIGDPIAWAREFMLKIVADDSQVVDPRWITRYDNIPDDVRYYAIGVDPAISEKDSADSTAIVCAAVVGSGEDQKIYVLPNPVNKRMSFLESVETIQTLGRTLQTKAEVEIFVEDVQYQRALVQVLASRNWNVQGVRVDRRDKRSRLSPVSYLIERKEIMFPNVGCEELIQQLVGFPLEKHDDLVDAFSMVGNKVIEKESLGYRGGLMQIVERDLKEMRSNGGTPPRKPTLGINDMLRAVNRQRFGYPFA